MVRRLTARFLCFGFLATALYHLYWILEPDLLSDVPAWRHTLFLVINGVMSLLLIKNSRLFHPCLVLLTVQQIYSHGLELHARWVTEQRIDWPSVAVLAGLPVATWVLKPSRADQQSNMLKT